MLNLSLCAARARARIWTSRLEYSAGMSVTDVATRSKRFQEPAAMGAVSWPFLWEGDSSAGGRAWWTDRPYKNAMAEIEADIVAGATRLRVETWTSSCPGRLTPREESLPSRVL